ncbi:MAG: long-chain fatty acid--CoA ligase [Bacteroidota bacterium]
MEVKRLFDVLYYQLENYPQEDALVSKVNGQWKKYSTQEIIDIVNRLSLGLIKLGIGKGDKVGITSFNRPEWAFIDLAVQQLGAIDVPMYPNATESDYLYISEHAEIKIIFAGDEEIYNKSKSALDQVQSLTEIYTFDEVAGVKHWTEVEKLGEGEDVATLEPYKNNIEFEELATIIYTSGTTGKPKGVMLSHRNIISNTFAVKKVFPVDLGEERAMSFLPLCHIFERTALYTYMYMGISIYFAESMETIADNLKEVKPNLFTTVPRLLEKVYDKIEAKGYELTGLKRKLFFWAMGLAKTHDLNAKVGGWRGFQMKMANKLIFSKWREALGGNVKFIVSGAAALQSRLVNIFWAAQIPVLEGYGLTESSPGISFSRLEQGGTMAGCVGIVLDGVEVKIADDGEILVKGPNVMMGYYKQPDQTAQTIDKDSWLHTGDVGKLVNNKYLKITDRKKEIFKTSGGKYIAPQVIENKFKESTLIEQVMVVGEGEKFPSALIVPFFEGLREWCKIKEIQYTTDHEIITRETIIKKFETEIEKHNSQFAQYEKVKKFQLLSEPWAIDTGELTPTLKLKRKVIHEKHKEHIESFYTE